MSDGSLPHVSAMFNVNVIGMTENFIEGSMQLNYSSKRRTENMIMFFARFLGN